jgi:hypothetical protein
MKLTKCGPGHFYDADTYDSCPLCDSGVGAPEPPDSHTWYFCPVCGNEIKVDFVFLCFFCRKCNAEMQPGRSDKPHGEGSK